MAASADIRQGGTQQACYLRVMYRYLPSVNSVHLYSGGVRDKSRPGHFYLDQCFSNSPPPCGGAHKITVHIPRNQSQFLKRQFCKVSRCRTKILAIFHGLSFLAAFQNSYIFIPLFLSESQTVFCGILRFRGTQFEKHWSRLRRGLVSLSAGAVRTLG